MTNPGVGDPTLREGKVWENTEVAAGWRCGGAFGNRGWSQAGGGGAGGRRGQINHLLRVTPTMIRVGSPTTETQEEGGTRQQVATELAAAAHGQTVFLGSRQTRRHNHTQGDVFSPKQVYKGGRGLSGILPEGIGLLMPAQLSPNAVRDGGDKLPAQPQL